MECFSIPQELTSCTPAASLSVVGLHPEIDALDAQLQATGQDAAALVDGLTEDVGRWRAAPNVWSVAECIDHLAVADAIYMRAMAEPVRRAREQGRVRRKPALPGLLGGWFVRSLEPPVKAIRKMKAPRLIRPHIAPMLADAYRDFRSAHDDALAFLRANADLDLASITFPNPFIKGIHFSLATGLHVIAAHERRHLWQGWRARQAATQSASLRVG